MKRALKFLLAAAVMMTALNALAVPTVWTLAGVTFSDGGTASGSFVYDADSNTYSSINIVANGGTNPTLNTSYFFACTVPCSGLAPSSGAVLTLSVAPSNNLTGLPAFALIFSTSLDNGGGSRSVIGSQNATCNNARCTAPIAPTRTVAAGAIAAVAPPPRLVPTLSNSSLILLGMMMIGVAGFGAGRRMLARR